MNCVHLIIHNRNGHRWSLNKFVIDFPLHCNACETFLFTATGRIYTVFHLLILLLQLLCQLVQRNLKSYYSAVSEPVVQCI